MKRLRFNSFYFILFFVLLAIELGIALFVHDRFVRPYLGDVLVVILIYSFLLGFVELPVRKAAMGVLLFAFLVEGLQAMDLIALLGMEDSVWMITLLGNSFSWADMGCYVLGYGLILLMEASRKKSGNSPGPVA